MKPIKANYKQWRSATVGAIKTQRKNFREYGLGGMPSGAATRHRMAAELKARRKSFGKG
jgi:hypothetical protein